MRPALLPRSEPVQIRQGLIGRTGYNENVSELVFDWFGDGDTVQIAVVGKETLREADDFATAIGLQSGCVFRRSGSESVRK